MESFFIAVSDELVASAAECAFESGTIDLGQFSQGGDVYRFDEPLSYQLTLTNTSDAILVAGTVKGVGTCPCARCLADASYELEGQIEGYYLLPGSNRELSEEEADEFSALPDDHRIDLLPLVLAALSMDVPLVPLCSEDCKGLCPTCGADLNEGPCGCEPRHDDALSSNPFAVLKGYKPAGGENDGE